MSPRRHFEIVSPVKFDSAANVEHCLLACSIYLVHRYESNRVLAEFIFGPAITKHFSQGITSEGYRAAIESIVSSIYMHGSTF